MAKPDPGLRLRVLSALVLVPIALALVIVGGWGFAGFVEVAVVLMALEWAQLTAARHGRRAGWLAGGAVLVVGMGSTLLVALERYGMALAVLAAGAVLAGLAAQARGGPGLWTGLGVGYVGLPALALIWLRSVPDLGLSVLIWLFLVVWAADSSVCLCCVDPLIARVVSFVCGCVPPPPPPP